MSDLIDRQAAIEAVLTELTKRERKNLLHTWSTVEVKYFTTKMLEDMPSAQRWIPCSERLPEDDVDVFVYLFERPVPYIAWVENCRWYTEDFEVEKENYPTAWMPLPEPYKGEQE